MIRKATAIDIPRILELLHQVNMVHYRIRPDLFRPDTTKYTEQELRTMLGEERTPVFVCDDGGVRGYAFCQIKDVKDDILLQAIKTLYVDDICVDERARGKHIGKALFDFVREYASAMGCHNITLNAWEGNEPALCFYRKMGMQVQRTTMEVILKQ